VWEKKKNGLGRERGTQVHGTTKKGKSVGKFIVGAVGMRLAVNTTRESGLVMALRRLNCGSLRLWEAGEERKERRVWGVGSVLLFSFGSHLPVSVCCFLVVLGVIAVGMRKE
jgi:hypothetical protein